jgi:hypothetical protein
MASFRVRAFAVATCLGLLGGVGAGPARTSLISKNLLVNGNAEKGAAANDAKNTVRPLGWTTVGSFSAVSYGIAGLPSVQTSMNIDGGNHFFAGGPTIAPASATETVAIPAAWRTVVASGRAFAQMSAYLGGSQAKRDAAFVVVGCLNAKRKSLGGFKIGPVTATRRGNLTELLPVQATHVVARTCTSIRVTIASTGGSGTYDDAYADNLVLRLLQ